MRKPLKFKDITIHFSQILDEEAPVCIKFVKDDIEVIPVKRLYYVGTEKIAAFYSKLSPDCLQNSKIEELLKKCIKENDLSYVYDACRSRKKFFSVRGGVVGEPKAN